MQLDQICDQKRKLEVYENDIKGKEHQLQRVKTDLEIQSQKLKIHSESVDRTMNDIEARERKLNEQESKIGNLF